MNRSTTLYIAIATLVLGSGASYFAFVQPALTTQAKLKGQKAGLETQKAGLSVQVKDLEAKATGVAMLDIAFFDLRASKNQRRELETKTVQTLQSLTEVFNDNKLRVQELAPTGESVGLNKPVPSAAPSGTASPEAPAATPTPAAGAAETPSPISLTHKAFKIKVRGEYADFVKAMTEIQGLPKAISVSQYSMQLLDKGGDAPAAPQPAEGARPESPTALEMSFHVSITFLMAGGTPIAAPSPASVPVGAQRPMDLAALAEWLLGGVAIAAEDAAPTPAKPVAASRYELKGVVADAGGLRLVTAGGTPPFSLVGLTRSKAVLELANTSLMPGATASAAPGGAIVDVRVVSTRPGVVRVIVETDGTKRLMTQLDRAERLHLVPTAWQAEPAPKAKTPTSKAPAAAAQTARSASLTRVEGVSLEGDELVVKTTGGAPRFSELGGTPTRLVVELAGAGVIPAAGRLFPIGAQGIKQVRAVLFKNKPMTTRLVVDTDGSVKLSAYAGADGRLRVRIAPRGTAAAKPAAQGAKQPAQAKAAVPDPQRTPMAVPGQRAPLAKANTPVPRPKPSRFPDPASAPGTAAPHLQRSLSSSYAFPIERDRVTGRANPFKVLPNRAKPKAVTPDAADRVSLPPAPAIGNSPVLPLPGVPAAPAAPAKTYMLTAVIIGGGQPPVAAIKVDGKTHMVGLNESLPGNATVKSIQPDHVVLTSFEQDIRIGLKQ